MSRVCSWLKRVLWVMFPGTAPCSCEKEMMVRWVNKPGSTVVKLDGVAKTGRQGEAGVRVKGILGGLHVMMQVRSCMDAL